MKKAGSQILEPAHADLLSRPLWWSSLPPEPTPSVYSVLVRKNQQPHHPEGRTRDSPQLRGSLRARRSGWEVGPTYTRSAWRTAGRFDWEAIQDLIPGHPLDYPVRNPWSDCTAIHFGHSILRKRKNPRFSNRSVEI